jgi:hypothetical protein
MHERTGSPPLPAGLMTMRVSKDIQPTVLEAHASAEQIIELRPWTIGLLTFYN